MAAYRLVKTEIPFCCEELSEKVFCGEEPALAADNALVRVIPHFHEFGLNILDGGSSYSLIRFCPWCGQEFPKSLRNDWIDAVEEEGYSPWDRPDEIPDWFFSWNWKRDFTTRN